MNNDLVQNIMDIFGNKQIPVGRIKYALN